MYDARVCLAARFDSRLGALGAKLVPPDLATTFRAAEVRVALTHERMTLHTRRVHDAMEGDDALLHWRRP